MEQSKSGQHDDQDRTEDLADLSAAEDIRRPDPQADTSVIPADQLVRPGEREIPESPQARPAHLGPPTRKRRYGYDSFLRNVTLFLMGLVLILLILLVVSIILKKM
jgi:hypothetical protein